MGLIGVLAIMLSLFGGGNVFAQDNVYNTCVSHDNSDGTTTLVCKDDNGNVVLNVTYPTVGPQPEPPSTDGVHQQADCIDGPQLFDWSSAGPAPQTLTDAQARLGVGSSRDMTVQYPCPGDDTVIGWVVGTTDSEARGVIQTLDFIPAGTCVDFDPGASQVSGNIVHSQDFTPRWSRVLMESDGSAKGLKFTVWWTTCDFTDGFQAGPSSTGVTPPAEQPPVAQGCPTTQTEAASLIGGLSKYWSDDPNSPNGWLYGYNSPNSNVPKAELTTPEGFVVFTPGHPAGTAGLAVGKSENTRIASAYCER